MKPRTTTSMTKAFRGELRWSWGRAIPIFAASALVAGSVFAAINETHVYGVATLGGSGQCGDSSESHTVHTDTAGVFADHFKDLRSAGLWDDVDSNNNTSCRGSYWTDSSKTGACSCEADDANNNQGADDADVLFIHTHGGHTNGVRSGLRMGNSAYDCWVQTDNNMFFDADLDIAVVKACQSGNYDVWAGGGYRQQFTNSGSSLRMWNAFHGDSSCGNHVTRYVRRYANNSDYNGVGENWIDEAYDDSSSANDDDCPTSIVLGSTKPNRDHLFVYGGWRDREDTGAKTGSTIYYISGCDPSHGAVLP